MSLPSELLPVGLLGTGAADTEYLIERSLRFNSADSAYLDWTPASAGNRKTWTWAGWVKRGKASTGTEWFYIFDSVTTNPSTGENYIRINGNHAGHVIEFRLDSLSGAGFGTSQVFRDHSAWFHLVAVCDTTSATSTDRMRLYINGERVTDLSAVVDPTQNADGAINNTTYHSIGRTAQSGRYFDGYLADIHFIDGGTPSTDIDSDGSVTGIVGAEYLLDFGEFDADTGVWNPKAYTGSYGTNGFHLPFSDNSTAAALGTDTSPNGNDWTVNNIQATVQAGRLYYQGSGSSKTAAFSTANFAGNFPAAKADVNQAIFDADLLTSVTTATFSYQYTFSNVVEVLVSLDGTTWTSKGNKSNLDTTISHTSPFRYVRWYYDSFGFGIANNPAGNDSVVDVPTNGTETDTGSGGQVRGNYCTFNPLRNSNGALVNGNLDFIFSSGTYAATVGTIFVSSGKWYWEVTAPTITSNACRIGICSPNWAPNNTALGEDTNGYSYQSGGLKGYNASTSSYGAAYTSGDVIGIALDLDAGTLTFYKNGSSQGQAYSGITGLWGPALSLYTGTTGSAVLNAGARSFAYTAPSGFKALNTANLGDPVVTKPSEYFNAITYSGNSGDGLPTTQDITTGFSPDFVWIKSRTDTNSNILFDIIRGAGKRLFSNLPNAEDTQAASLVSFNSDGFTVGGRNEVNDVGVNYISWNWDAGSNSSKTYTVTVPGGTGGGFYIDGDQKPTINLEEGSTYTFDQSDSSNSGHPFRFSETSDGTHGAGTEYTTNVTTFGTPGSAGAYTRIEVAASAPTLYYYCSNHSAMGGQINTNNTAGASNFDGSIPSVVRANPTAGFSIVTYTGDSSTSGSVGHGLGVAPSMVIIKVRNASKDWKVAHVILTDQYMLTLNETYAQNIASWDGVTSTVFKPARVGDTYNNTSGENYVAYCFAPVESYSAFGSYIGNGSTTGDGPFVFCGFRPRWVMVKCSTDGTSASDWFIFDSERNTYNLVNSQLYPNRSIAESTSNTHAFDFVSNGFKVRSTSTSTLSNGSGQTYIYYAVAESPFQYARAR